jgi:hypothetical protein
MTVLIIGTWVNASIRPAEKVLSPADKLTEAVCMPVAIEKCPGLKKQALKS